MIVTLHSLEVHSTTAPIIDLTKERDIINNKVVDEEEEKYKNQEDHDSDFGQTQKDSESATPLKRYYQDFRNQQFHLKLQ